MSNFYDTFLNGKVTKILANHKTIDYEECNNLAIKLDTYQYKDLSYRLMDIARYKYLYKEMTKQARIVLEGKCPCRREFIGYKTITISPRDWLTYKQEVSEYSRCLWCGD